MRKLIKYLLIVIIVAVIVFVGIEIVKSFNTKEQKENTKNDNQKIIQVTYNFSDGGEHRVYTKTYFKDNKIKFLEQIETFDSEEEAKKQYESIKNVDECKLENKTITMTLYYPEDYEMDYEGYINFLNEEKERGAVKEYFEVDN